MKTSIFSLILFGILFSAIAGCSSNNNPPAPPGDKAVLENLADAYRDGSSDLPARPTSLPPEHKKKFVRQVFRDAGYSYEATLHNLATGALQPSEKLHRDLVELLFLPHKGLTPEAMDQLYSDTELNDIKKIEAALPR